jgi:hypothetical protein
LTAEYVFSLLNPKRSLQPFAADKTRVNKLTSVQSFQASITPTPALAPIVSVLSTPVVGTANFDFKVQFQLFTVLPATSEPYVLTLTLVNSASNSSALVGVGSTGLGVGKYKLTLVAGAADPFKTHIVDGVDFTGTVGLRHSIDILAKDQYNNPVTGSVVWGFNTGQPYIVPLATEAFVTATTEVRVLGRFNRCGLVYRL